MLKLGISNLWPPLRAEFISSLVRT